MNEEEKVRQAIKSLVRRLGPCEWLLLSASNTVLSYRYEGDQVFAVGERKAVRLLAERERERERQP